MNRKHALARKLATSAVAIGLGFGATMVVASPAQAATCTLTIGGQDENGRYPVFVGCTDGINAAFGLWGSDPVFDDFQGGPFFSGAHVLRGVLNEDDSFFDNEDEIYAVVGATGIRTNTVVRNF